MDNIKIGKERGNPYKRNEEVSGWKAHINTCDMWCHLYCVFSYIYSLLIERDICDCWNVSVKLLCVYVYLSSEDLFIFSVRVSSFFSYFCVMRIYLSWSQFTPSLTILLLIMIKNMLKRRKESGACLATDSRHCWSV